MSLSGISVWFTTTKYVKVFFIIFTVLFILLLFTINSREYVPNESVDNFNYNNTSNLYKNHDFEGNLKYILLWTSKNNEPLNFLGENTSIFIKQKCFHTKCYVTDDRNFLADLSQFDSVIFNGPDIYRWQKLDLPNSRSVTQKYVFVGVESPSNYPICKAAFDNFFNWTWSYKLNADFRFGYFNIVDLNDHIVGPAVSISWPLEFEPLDDSVKAKLKYKSKAAAWFVSSCNAKSGRDKFVKEAQRELYKYGWSVDIYGACGPFKCAKLNSDTCFKMIERDYYFYFSFENTFADDYVTEKLLTGLNYYAVPVVYGGANYSRFLAPGTYLNAKELGPKHLAQTMDYIIRNETVYHDFFRWRNHYAYRDTTKTDLCNICDALNNEEMVKRRSTYERFREWWNDDNC